MSWKIQTRITQRAYSTPSRYTASERNHNLSNLVSVNIVKTPATNHHNKVQNHLLPTVLMANVRSLSPKVDELGMIANVNSVDIIAVTETWLASDIPDNAVDIPNFNLFRKDRNDPIKRNGGGVGAYISTSHPTRRIHDFDNPNIESLWLAIRPHRLPGHTSVILLAVVYHPTDSTAVDNEALLEHLQSSTDSFLANHPDALVIITGDFNPNSTNLKTSVISRRLGLSQLVKCNTRDTGILDLYFVNKTKLFMEPKQLPRIGTSDHYAILIQSTANPQLKSNTQRPVQYRREMRESNIGEFGRWITGHNWNALYKLDNCEEKYDLFLTLVSNAIEKHFPLKRCRLSNTDKPWVTSRLKALISKRQTAFHKYGKLSIQYKSFRIKVKSEISKSKSIYYHNRVKRLKDSNISKWWRETKMLGRVTSNNEW